MLHTLDVQGLFVRFCPNYNQFLGRPGHCHVQVRGGDQAARRVILDETGLDHHDGIELQTLDRFSAADADLLIPFGLLDEPCVFGRVKNDSQFAAHGIAHRGDEIIRTDDGDAAGAVWRNELFGRLGENNCTASCAACSAVVSSKDDMSGTTLRDTESGMVRTALTVEM